MVNYRVIFIHEAAIGKTSKTMPRIFLDPNSWSAKGTTALKWTELSTDGKIMAYGISEKGSDWTHVRFLYVPSGQYLKDELKNLKFSPVSFTHDNLGVIYCV